MTTTTEPIATISRDESGKQLFLSAARDNIEDFSTLFSESEDQVPVFVGTTDLERTAAWRALNKRDKWTQWRKASIAASLVRQVGQRTDLRQGETAVQQFCRANGIGPQHCSRMARTHRVFFELLATGSKQSLYDLMDDESLSFKHFYIAATAAVLPVEALLEAKMYGWSAGELGRMLTARKQSTLLDQADGTPVRPEDDDDLPNLSWRGLPDRNEESSAKSPHTRQVNLVLTTREHAIFVKQLRALRGVLGTTYDAEKRHAESSESARKGDAERMLQRRVGAREHNLPVIPHAERLTFDDAAKAVITDYAINHKASLSVLRRRIEKHLTPFFGGRRMAGITPTVVAAYVAKRQADTIVTRKSRVVRLDDGTDQHVPEERKPVSNSEINRELSNLKRVFSLAIKSGRIATKPYIPLLREPPPRSGFFEAEQIAAVVTQLPAEIQGVVEFAYITGWRVADEVLPLEWRQVDFQAGEVRLDAGTTKNGEGRVFPMTTELRRLLKAQHAEHERLQKAGHIAPWVFFRMVAEGRGGQKKPRPIVSFNKAWKNACAAAGCPGRIPHDMRRSAVRNFVRASIPERVAMQLTGHKTRSVFDRYNIVSDGDLRDAARRLDATSSHLAGRTARQS